MSKHRSSVHRSEQLIFSKHRRVLLTKGAVSLKELSQVKFHSLVHEAKAAADHAKVLRSLLYFKFLAWLGLAKEV